MKKWGLVLLVILFSSWAGICLWIPGEMNLSVAMNAGCSQTGAFRRLTQETCWEKWWPQARLMNQPYCGPDRHPFLYESYSYQLTGINPKGIEVAIQQGDFSCDTRIAIVPGKNPDTISLEWQGSLSDNSLNPFERVRQYQRVGAIRKSMAGILSSLCSFLGKNENIYGIEVRELPFGELPFAGLHQPLPLSLRDSAKILTSEVRGGGWTVTYARDQLHVFMKDYHRDSAAPTFELRITDRNKEPDTTKWVTYVYCPVL